MYVGKISGSGWRLTASVYQKTWSNELSSNKIELINSKRFFLKFMAKNWINATICKDLLKHKELEINDERK